MPEENYPFHHGEELMSPDEIEKLATCFVELGVNKIRLTGGEPLLRKDFASILTKLSKLPVELLLTTNGVLIDKYLENLKDAGIKKVNVSLDSLKESKFQEITGRKMFNRVWDNIQLLLTNNFEVKINVVAMKHIVNEEFWDFVSLTENLPIELRFIEFMPFEGNHWNSDMVVTAPEMVSWLKSKHSLEKLVDLPHSTTKKYKINGFEGSIAFITTMSHQFCGDCNRLRLTAEGKIKNCLFGNDELDLLSELRNGNDIKPLIELSVAKKHAALGGQLAPDYQLIKAETIQNRSMIGIGG